MSTALNAADLQSEHKRRVRGLVAVFTAYFASSFYFYGLTVAAPKIAADLNGMPLYSWAISLPALGAAFTTLIFGKLSDMYGRRIILALCMVLFLTGAILGATSQTFVFNIAARVVLALGQGAVPPLCFSVVGDLFPPAERSRWSGLLNIPSGMMAIISPTLIGMISDNLSWRYLFGITAPLVAIAGLAVLLGVPTLTQRATHKIDFLGSCLLATASATMILGFSWAGTTVAWGSVQIISLFAISLGAGALFLWVEGRAEEPMLDPQVLRNRTFITAGVAGFMSFFGLLGVLMYYPLFLQGVQGRSGTLSGQMITPFSVVMAFMGVPAGFLLARTKRYKWMLLAGYAILTAAMFGMATFNVGTPIWMSILVTTLAGFGLGTIPTVNTLVAQFAVPKRLLGVSVGAMFFFVILGRAIAPAILGSAMNATYATHLQSAIPEELIRVADKETLMSLADTRVLLSPQAVASLQATLARHGDERLFARTIAAIRGSLEASLKTVFLIGALTMLVSFFLVVSIPEVSMDREVEDKRAPARREETPVPAASIPLLGTDDAE
jgi:MFS family permease